MFKDTVPTLLRCTKASQEREAKKPATRPPSQRDQEIFKRIAVGGERQTAVAAELKLTKGRISQIVGRVRRWLAEGSPGDPELLSWRQRQRLERALALARQQAIYDEALRELARRQAHPQEIVTRTETKDGEETKVVTTVRDAPLNIQLLKTAQRAAAELERLSQREPLPDEPPPMPGERELEEHARYALCELRRLAEKAGRVTTGLQPAAVIVDSLLGALLGADSYGLPHEPAAREIAERLLTGQSSSGPGAEQRREQAAADELNRAIPAADEKAAARPPAASPAESANAEPATVSGEQAEQPAAGPAAATRMEKTESLTPVGGGQRRRRLAVAQPPHRRLDRQKRRRTRRLAIPQPVG
jgi:hypothetical protein